MSSTDIQMSEATTTAVPPENNPRGHYVPEPNIVRGIRAAQKAWLERYPRTSRKAGATPASVRVRRSNACKQATREFLNRLIREHGRWVVALTNGGRVTATEYHAKLAARIISNDFFASDPFDFASNSAEDLSTVISSTRPPATADSSAAPRKKRARAAAPSAAEAGDDAPAADAAAAAAPAQSALSPHGDYHSDEE